MRPQLPFLSSTTSSLLSRPRAAPLLTRLARLPLTTERRAYLRSGHWIDRVLGVVFLVFAASLVAASLP